MLTWKGLKFSKRHAFSRKLATRDFNIVISSTMASAKWNVEITDFSEINTNLLALYLYSVLGLRINCPLNE